MLISIGASSQSIIVDDTFTAQQLVDSLVNSSCAQISNVQVKGWAGTTGGNSYGYFNAPTGFPFESGIILSSGFAASAMGPNSTDLSEGTPNWFGDNDLQAAVNIQNTMNATVLEFDFVPITNTISFDFMFVSEEYTSGIGCDFSDAFAFLLKEAGSADPYQNLAVIPGTQTPVTVTTVRGIGSGCPSANIRYFDKFNNNTHPTTNYNGQTKVLTAQANVTAGTVYHIKLVIADQTDTQYDSAIFLGANSFNIGTDLGVDRLLSTNNPLCGTERLQVDATTPGAIGYQWYKNNVVLLGEINAVYEIRDNGNYTAEIELGTGCFSETTIKAEYSPLPPVVAHQLLQCDDDTDGRTVYNLNLADSALGAGPNINVSYYIDSTAANAETGSIINPEAYYNTTANQVIYARVENEYGCYSISTVTLNTVPGVSVTPQQLTECDDVGAKDGLKDFDLTVAGQLILQNAPAGAQLDYYTTQESALLSRNAIPNPQQFINTTPFGQTVYARIQNGGGCYAITEIELIANIFEDLPVEEEVVCAGSDITLDGGSEYIAFEWNTQPPQYTQFVTVGEAGTYTVTLTNADNCKGTKTFNVKGSGAATGADITINDFAASENSISIVPQGPGNYLYSIDGVTYREEPFFSGLSPDEYTVYIVDTNGCGPIYRDVVYVMDYPRFFTPNGDGENDIWRVPYIQFAPNANITIFDRYGKLITRFGNAGGWDGTFNGTSLPSTDYWFVITLQNGRIIRGHFAMLR